MVLRKWDYGKSLIKGILIAFIVILSYTLFDFIYFNNQMLLADNIDYIKINVVAFSILLFLGLIYFFYSRLLIKDFSLLLLLSGPYFLVLSLSILVSNNFPRLVDVLYIIVGVFIINGIFRDVSFFYNRKYLLVLFLVVTFVSYAFVYENINFAYNKNKTENIDVNGVYDFSIKDINGNVLKISDLKTKTVCIDMWSSTCGGCIRSMPEFEKLSMYFKANPDYKIISLFCPMKEHETYEWFLDYIKEDFDYNIDYYYINKGEFEKLGIYQFPEIFLLNKNNKIVYRGVITYKKSTNDNIYEMLEKINLNE